MSDLWKWFSNFLDNLTSEDIQRYVRISIYYISGYVAGHGWASSEVVLGYTGLVVGGVNFTWSVWGMRFKAKVRELAKIDVVEKVLVTSPELAASIPSPKVTTG